VGGVGGTVGAVTEVRIKVLPGPGAGQTVVVPSLEPARAMEAMTSAMGSSCDVSGAAHLPAGVAARVEAGGIAADAVTALRLEGFSPSVAERKRLLEALMQPFGELATLQAPASRGMSAAARDAAAL